MSNRLVNPGFEEGISGHLCHVVTPDPAADQWMYDTERGEVNPPTGWEVWYVHDERPPEHDPGNKNGWCEPEARLAPHEERVLDGEYGYLLFTFFRIHDGGLFQRVPVTPGDRVQFSIQAHAWASNSDDPGESVGVGDDAFFALAGESDHDAVTFWVGIDPQGGTDPLAESVVWGKGAHIYNAYREVPTVEAVAESDCVTVFTRGMFRWPFKHCDQYYDGAALEVIREEDDEPEPPAPPTPVGYDYPVIAQGSKLHPHAIGEGGTYDLLIEMAKAGQPLPFVKLYCRDSASVWADRVKELSPTTKVIARVIHGEDGDVNVGGVDVWNVDPQDYMDNLRATFEANPDVDWWELWNEDDPPGTEDDPAAGQVQMARFALDCMDIAENWGVKLALMSYSTGVPENYEWQAMWERTDFFQRAKAGGHILSLHAYGLTKNADDVTYQLMRPRWLYEEILIPNDCVVPFVFTEYSIHETAPGEGITNWETDALMAEYERADALFGSMWYCLGASIFTFGLGWGHYNHNEVWRDVAALLKCLSDRENALPPVVDAPELPEPPEPDGFDRYVMVVDYGRITDEAVRETLYIEAAQRGIYCGPSHDEAANRPANARTNTVELPGFSEEDVDYIEWYKARDPEVRLVFRDIEAASTPEPPPADPSASLPWDRDISEDLPSNQDAATIWWRRRLDQINAVTIHHTGGSGDWKAVAADHLQRDGGTETIHYSIGIDPDGTVNLMVPLGDVHPAPWHDHTGWNNTHLAVVLAGRLHVNPPTDSQLAALVRVCRWAIEHPEMAVTRKTITGHMDWFSTACPGWLSDASGRWKTRFFGMLDDELTGGSSSPPTSPPSGSVRGVHCPIATAPPGDIDILIDRLTSMGIKWYKVLYDGNPRTITLMEALMDAGIQPVVRIYDGHQRPQRNQVIVRDPRSARRIVDVVTYHPEHHVNFRAYVEPMNEPNLPGEWDPGRADMVNWQNPEAVQAIADSWWADAQDILDWGGCPGLPAMAPTDRGGTNAKYSGWKWWTGVFDALMRDHGAGLAQLLDQGRVWIAAHSASFARPFDYDPRRLWGVDDMCLRGYEPIYEHAARATGAEPVVILTEGGVYSPFHMQQLEWSADGKRVFYEGTDELFYDNATWGDRVVEAFDFLEQRGIVKGACMWHLADAGSSPEWHGNGWYGTTWNARTPVGALIGS